MKMGWDYSRTEIKVQMKQNGALIYKPTKVQLSDFFFCDKDAIIYKGSKDTLLINGADKISHLI